MKNKNPPQNHLCSLFFLLLQSLYLCFTLTQILTSTFEGKCLVPLIVTVCSIFPNVFVQSPDSVTLGKRVCCRALCSVCLKKTKAKLLHFITQYQTTFSRHVCLLVLKQ